MQDTPVSHSPPPERVRFVVETPEMYGSEASQAYIRQEIERPSKAWVQEVVESTRETEFVKLRTADFVLLPDLNCHRRHPPRHPAPPFRARPAHPSPGVDPPCDPAIVAIGASLRPQRPAPVLCGRPSSAPLACTRYFAWNPGMSRRGGAASTTSPGGRPPTPYHASRRFNWLAIVADPSIRSIRDLRGEHLPLLERMYRTCVQAIQREHRVGLEDIMVFANYPPSVYKLHFHFCAPFFQPTAYDAFRMHSLSAIINNLRVDPGYYAVSTFQIPVHTNSDLYRAIVASRGECGNLSSTSSSSSSVFSDDGGGEDPP